MDCQDVNPRDLDSVVRECPLASAASDGDSSGLVTHRPGCECRAGLPSLGVQGDTLV